MDRIRFEELRSFLILNRTGRKKEILAQLREGVGASSLLEFFSDEKKRGSPSSAEFHPEREIERCEHEGIRLMTFADDDYPVLLKEIYDPPLVLYVAGHFIPEDRSAVAIVGTRNPSCYGLIQTRRFVRGLSEKGLTIVSGFAKGIDAAAHTAALEIAYGRTVAVLGCGIDVDYPRGASKLFEKITDQGAVISEYPLGMPPLAENFPRRNRIISGLSLGVLVVEAHERSGSLITAHEAAEQGREVFAIPGPVDQLTSRGTHQLLKEGAMLAEAPEDIFEALSIPLLIRDQASAGCPDPLLGDPEGKTDQGAGKTDEVVSAHEENGEKELLDLLSSGELGWEEILMRTGLDVGPALSRLTRLELRLKIRKNAAGRFEIRK